MNCLKTEKINQCRIKPVKKLKLSPENIKGSDMFKMLYPNIFICAKRQSGKSTLIYNIIKNCCDKNYNVVIFCNTVFKDDTYLQLQEMMKRKKINFDLYDSLYDKKVNILADYKAKFKQTAEQEQLKKNTVKQQKPKFIRTDDSDSEDDEEIKTPKKISPEYTFIFDDFGDDLKNSEVVSFLKQARHWRVRCIFSSQYIKDLDPQSRNNIDYYIIFGSMPDENLQVIYKAASIDMPFEKFKNIYLNTTKDKYNFLYINQNNNEFRKCFNEKIIL